MEFKGTKGDFFIDDSREYVNEHGAMVRVISSDKGVVHLAEFYGRDDFANYDILLFIHAKPMLKALQELIDTCPCDPDITTEFWQANQKAKQIIKEATEL